MAANHVTEMAAYTPDNDRCYNWREKHKRELLTIIIIEDVKMDRCLLLEIDKNKLMYTSEIYRQFYGGKIHTKFRDKKYHKRGHTDSSAKCWRKNKIDKNCGQQKLWTAHGQFQEDEKFFGQPS